MSTPSDSGRLAMPPSGISSERTAPWSFRRYVAWRLVCVAILILVLLTAVFVVVEVLPGDPTRVLLPRGGCSGVGCALRDELIHQWGLDRPLLDRYAIFLWNMLTGNLGVSVTYRPGTPVWDVIASRLPGTLVLTGVVTVLLALFSIPIGSRLSRKKGGILDQVVSSVLALGFAVPPLLLALLAMYFFVTVYPVFPLNPLPSPDPLVQFGNDVSSRVLPGLVVLGTTLGLYSWVVRDFPLRSVADLNPLPPGEWRRERQTLRSRIVGVLPRFLAALPILFPWTFVAILFAEMMSNVNGFGLLLWTATVNLDFFVLAGVIVVLGLLVLLPVGFVADVLRYRMTMTWRRVDEDRVRTFQVDIGDPLRWLWRIITSVFGLVGLVLILAVLVLSVAAPFIAGPYPTPFTASQPRLPPSPTHPLGTDFVGYDVATLLVFGGQAVPATAALGFLLGLLAGAITVGLIGLLGERATTFLETVADIFLILSIPFLFLLVTAVGRGSEIWASAMFGWPIAARVLLMDTTRMAPSLGSNVRPKPTFEERGDRAARLLWGAGPLILADALLASSLTVIAWATLGFVGLEPTGAGVPETWGGMVGNAYFDLGMLRGTWWEFVPPILCILVAVLGPTLLSLRMRRIYDEMPRIAVPATSPTPVVPSAPPGPNP